MDGVMDGWMDGWMDGSSQNFGTTLSYSISEPARMSQWIPQGSPKLEISSLLNALKSVFTTFQSF